METASVSVCSTCWIKHVLRWLDPLKKKPHIKPSLQTGSSQHLAQCHAEHRTDRRRSAQTPGWDWTSCSAFLSPPQTTPPRTPGCAPATGETNRTKLIKRTKDIFIIFCAALISACSFFSSFSHDQWPVTELVIKVISVTYGNSHLACV